MRRVRHCPEGRGSEVMFCGRSIDSLESLDAGTHPFVVKNMRTAPEEPQLTAFLGLDKWFPI
jgi:hypothetical protein